MNVVGETAHVYLAAPESPFVGTATVVRGGTARVWLYLGGGDVEKLLPGDMFRAPIEISGVSGSRVVDFYRPGGWSGMYASPEVGEETTVPEETSWGTIWLRYTAPNEPGTVTIPVDDMHFVEAFNVPPGALSHQDAQRIDLGVPLGEEFPYDTAPPVDAIRDGEVKLTTGGGSQIMLRVTVRGDYHRQPMTLQWEFTERIPELVIEVHNKLPSTPGQLLVTIANVEPDMDVRFSLPGHEDFFVTVSDTSGRIDRASIPIDILLPAGAHGLSARTTRGYGIAEFHVQSDPDDRPLPLPVVANPEAVPATNRWTVQERVGTTAVNWVFPRNPTEATSPNPQRPFTHQVTTSPGGQALTWEGAIRAHEWQFRGYLDTEEFYRRLEDLVNSEVRYWLIDHRGQYRLVSFENFEPRYRRSVDRTGALNNWSFEYTVTVLVYRHLLELP